MGFTDVVSRRETLISILTEMRDHYYDPEGFIVKLTCLSYCS